MGKAQSGMRNTFLPMREAAATLGERKWHKNARKASKRIIGCKRMSSLCCANGKTEASEQPALPQASSSTRRTKLCARRGACGKQGDEHAGRHMPAVAPEMVTGKAKNLNTCRHAAE